MLCLAADVLKPLLSWLWYRHLAMANCRRACVQCANEDMILKFLIHGRRTVMLLADVTQLLRSEKDRHRCIMMLWAQL